MTLFAPEQCWALRRGRPHYALNPQTDPYCQHISCAQELPSASLCVPLVAHGEALGVLSLTGAALADGPQSDYGRLASAVAEHLALGLANLRMRDALRQTSIRDPLTDLFNRRYLEEALDAEISRAQRAGTTVALIVADVDHFKRVNDTHGHEAGDEALVAIAQSLKRCVRGGDIACRLGGEEFLLVLPLASQAVAEQRAETLRELTEHLRLASGGRTIAGVTVSLGVAVFPGHGGSREALLLAADRALYQAKAAGRNRTVVASHDPQGAAAVTPPGAEVRS